MSVYVDLVEDVVDFQKFSFKAVTQVSVIFFGVKMQFDMVDLVHVFWSFSEHVQKIDYLKQVTKF